MPSRAALPHCRYGTRCKLRNCRFWHPPPPMIMIDGMNLCHAHQNGVASAEPLIRGIQYFETRGYDVHIVLPQWAYDGGRDGNRHVHNARGLTPFVLDRLVSFTPAHVDDDRFFLQFARDRPHVYVLSNDSFGQYVASGLITNEWRNSRVIKYAFVCGVFEPAYAP